jgi:hypothetical protein
MQQVNYRWYFRSYRMLRWLDCFNVRFGITYVSHHQNSTLQETKISSYQFRWCSIQGEQTSNLQRGF